MRESTLHRALEVAVRAHAGQVDKGGKPFILHPLRVMLAGRTEDEMVLGVLHDVVEDTALELSDLDFLSDRVLRALDAITHRHEVSEPRVEYLARVKEHDLARRVKLADTRDNLSPERVEDLPEKDRERVLAKYAEALRVLDQPKEEL